MVCPTCVWSCGSRPCVCGVPVSVEAEAKCCPGVLSCWMRSGWDIPSASTCMHPPFFTNPVNPLCFFAVFSDLFPWLINILFCFSALWIFFIHFSSGLTCLFSNELVLNFVVVDVCVCVWAFTSEVLFGMLPEQTHTQACLVDTVVFKSQYWFGSSDLWSFWEMQVKHKKAILNCIWKPLWKEVLAIFLGAIMEKICNFFLSKIIYIS